MRRWLLAVSIFILLGVGHANAQVSLAPFLKSDGFGDVQLSPDGTYLAATVKKKDRTGLIVIRRADMARTAAFSLGRDTHIQAFEWVSDERLLISMAEQFGTEDKLTATGELYAVDADGKGAEILVGYRVQETGATRLRRQREGMVAAYLIDDLPEDDHYVMVEVWPFAPEPWSKAERMHVKSGKRVTVATSPVPRTSFSTDHDGVVRFARGSLSDNWSKLYHRPDDDADWVLVNDESKTGVLERVVGFSTDNRTAYLLASREDGPDAIVSFDTVTRDRKELLRDGKVDPFAVLTAPGGRQPEGVLYSGDGVRSAFFDEQSETAQLYRLLERSFPGHGVVIESATEDGSLALVQVWNATNPGDFYLFDVHEKRAEHVLARLDWFVPEQMAPVRAVSYKARDGLEIDGFLTTPPGGDKGQALVLMPHGGPFGVFDAWGFDKEAQLLAKAGYAVLQVNFRGSGNRGRAFRMAGAREWGGKMQEDLVDAVNWATAQGIADPSRICVVGASYGAYAAMVGLATTPQLFKCGVGYIGVYDLPKMVADDSKSSRATDTWMREWVGEGELLRDRSPTNMVDRIRAPVLLVAGGEDTVAPIEHSRLMERRLKSAGVPVETLYVSGEGHGFYEEKNRRSYYEHLLGFLSTHLGGQRAAP